MGFFYKAGGAAGTSVHEESSYTALATAAKTLDHAQLMRDTSTDFYYKNWKTGGPGIPVPVRYFDDVTGYFADASYSAYIQPSDTLADLTGRGWTATEPGTSSVTKSASAALVVDSPANSNDTPSLGFQSTGRNERYLMIVDIDSLAVGTSGGYTQGVADVFEPHDISKSPNGRFLHYQNWSYDTVSNSSINYYVRYSGFSAYNGAGPANAFSSGWIFRVFDVNTAHLWSAELATDSELQQIFDYGQATGSGFSENATGDKFRFMCLAPSSGSHTQYTYSVNEFHMLKI